MSKNKKKFNVSFLFSLEANGIYAKRREGTFRRLFEVMKKETGKKLRNKGGNIGNSRRTLRKVHFLPGCV